MVPSPGDCVIFRMKAKPSDECSSPGTPSQGSPLPHPNFAQLEGGRAQWRQPRVTWPAVADIAIRDAERVTWNQQLHLGKNLSGHKSARRTTARVSSAG